MKDNSKRTFLHKKKKSHRHHKVTHKQDESVVKAQLLATENEQVLLIAGVS